jgi:aminoglycoside phosphotransferase (APT) family kinase protein
MDLIIKNILNQLGIKDASYRKIEEDSFGSNVYILSVNDSEVIFKLPYNSTKFFREVGVYNYLANTKLCPKLIDRVMPKDGHNGAILIEKNDGRSINESLITVVDAESFGELLAKFHSIDIKGLGNFTKDGFKLIDYKSWWDYRSDLLINVWGKRIQTRMDKKLFESCLSYLKEYYVRFQNKKSTPCLIHCDYRPANILKNKSGELSLIDFESTRSGDPGYDFIKMYESFGHDKKRWQAFQKGYADIKELPDLESLIPYYEFELNFGFLHWAMEHNDDVLFEDRLSTVKKLIMQK